MVLLLNLKIKEMAKVKTHKTWTEEETNTLLSLINQGMSNSDIAIQMNRTTTSIIDKQQILKDMKQLRYQEPWLLEEDSDILNGMKNPEMQAKWQRGKNH